VVIGGRYRGSGEWPGMAGNPPLRRGLPGARPRAALEDPARLA